jgi:hypothetical protein
MKRSRQLVIESIVFAIVLMLLILGGTIEGIRIPFGAIQNPNQVQNQTDLNALALYYNTTLSFLAGGKYNTTAFYLKTFNFVNIPADVDQTAYTANNQVGSINVSVPLAITDFANASRFFSLNEFQNATLATNAGCAQARNANQTLAQFVYTTTPNFHDLGVPVSKYSIGEGLVQALVARLNAECTSLSGQLTNLSGSSGTGSTGVVTVNGTITKFLISSPQTSIETGGYVLVQGNLTQNSALIGDQKAYFYFDGTYIGSNEIAPSGYFTANLSIPFVYVASGALWAFVGSNASVSLPGITSNTLYFTILFNSTRIVIGDPPAYLPTESFSVSGNLSTASGAPVPLAPMQVSFLNATVKVYTNSVGQFGATFVVPPNTPNGNYDVYARFAPVGVFGPSFNLTLIQVVREILNLSAGTPWLSLAGFSSTLSGNILTQNGSAVPNASILVNSPWGVFRGISNASGGFAIKVGIPIWEFAFWKPVTVSATPVQPFVDSGRAASSFELFNILWLVIPGIIVGFSAYEAKNLGLLPALKKLSASRPRRKKVEAIQVREQAIAIGEEALGDIIQTKAKAHRMISIYMEAVGLAVQRFAGVTFKDSFTIREVFNAVKRRSAEDQNRSSPRAMELFQEISSASEDYLYSSHFEAKLVNDAEAWIDELRSLWGKSST